MASTRTASSVAIVRIATGVIFFAEGFSKITGEFVRGGFAGSARAIPAAPPAALAAREQLSDLPLGGRDRELPRKGADLPAGAVEEDGVRQLASPRRIDRVDEGLVVSPLFPVVVGKRRAAVSQELLDGRPLLLEIRGDSHDAQTRDPIALLEAREARELLPARDAPRRPEVHQDDVAPLPRHRLPEPV